MLEMQCSATGRFENVAQIRLGIPREELALSHRPMKEQDLSESEIVGNRGRLSHVRPR
jgi:hypothetical protein